MPNCTGDYIHWIDNAFGECISTPREKAGFYIGLLSTLIWMYAQFPQIWMNFKRKSVEGLSFAFLCLLLSGDICNITGVFLTGGLATQIITGIWYVFVDGFCVSQYVYYNWIRPKCIPDHEVAEKVPALGATPLLIAAAAAASSNPYKPPLLIGTLLGWCSALAYISSRCPQIIKNCKRKMTEGVSIQFFISAFLGNSTYAASIFLKDSSWGYIWQQMPWLAGSLGILFFDFTVLIQFLMYGNGKEKSNGEYENLVSKVDSSDKETEAKKD